MAPDPGWSWLGREEASLELRTFGCSGEWYDISDVGHTSYKLDRALKTQSKSRMGNRSVTPQVQIPGVFVVGYTWFVHSAFQYLTAFFALTSADNLTDSRDQNVHGTDSFTIIIFSFGGQIRRVCALQTVAIEFAADAKNDALDAATQLLRQSEDLRDMLDDLLRRIKSDEQAGARSS